MSARHTTLLGRPGLYEREIERLHTKYLLTGKLYGIQQEGVPFASLSMNASRLAKVIAGSIARREYQFAPGTVRLIRTQGKSREVYSFRLTDLIVQRAVSRTIEEAASTILSHRLYSYRPGLSWLAAASDFASYIRQYRRDRPDPRDRGLYVLRRDIASYTDSIPVGAKSKVWEKIRQTLGPVLAEPIDSYEWGLVQGVVRPVVEGEDGARFSLLRGLPTGQPIAPILYNLYLDEVDHQLDDVPGAFYGRYSDDIIFAHPDREVVLQAERRIEETVRDLNLGLNPDKSQNLYLTAAGRPPADWEGGRGTSSVPLVGTHVSAHGTVALNRLKMRALLRDLKRRAIRTARAIESRQPAEVGPIVCSAINRALEPSDTAHGQCSALIQRAVTDRSQLKQLDYWIARIVAEAVTGERDVRVFRRVRYREIRGEWGLRSLLHARNRWGQCA